VFRVGSRLLSPLELDVPSCPGRGTHPVLYWHVLFESRMDKSRLLPSRPKAGVSEANRWLPSHRVSDAVLAAHNQCPKN